MEFNWIFGPATVESSDTLSDIVVKIDWVCLLMNQGNPEWKTSGQVELPPVDPQNFIPFDLITESVVEGWVFSIINKQDIEQQITTTYEESLKVKAIPLPF